MKKTYKIDVDCANCANKMEYATKATEGVKNAVVNFMTLKMTVEFEEGVNQMCIRDRSNPYLKDIQQQIQQPLNLQLLLNF